MGIRSTLKKVFVPRLPRQSVSEIKAGLSWTVGMANSFMNETCPQCGSPLRYIRDYASVEDGKKIQFPALCCENPECKHVIPLIKEELSKVEVSERALRLRWEARQQMYICLAVLVISALIALYIHSAYTIGGGILLSFYIFLRALRVRYRAWQLEQNRLYEARAPLHDWLSYEIGRLQS